MDTNLLGFCSHTESRHALATLCHLVAYASYTLSALWPRESDA